MNFGEFWLRVAFDNSTGRRHRCNQSYDTYMKYNYKQQQQQPRLEPVTVAATTT
jgi:hypothetical protein